jgi:hypothetical protein
MNCFVLLALFVCLVSSQGQATRGRSDSSTAASNSSAYVPPSIRKCLNVSCAAGSFCFHGRCKKIDYECLSKVCEKGERCNKGKCVKQLHTPKKQICAPLGFEQTKLTCTD